MDLNVTNSALENELADSDHIRNSIENSNKISRKSVKTTKTSKIIHKEVDNIQTTLIKNLAYSEPPIGIISAKFTANELSVPIASSTFTLLAKLLTNMISIKFIGKKKTKTEKVLKKSKSMTKKKNKIPQEVHNLLEAKKYFYVFCPTGKNPIIESYYKINNHFEMFENILGYFYLKLYKRFLN